MPRLASFLTLAALGLTCACDAMAQPTGSGEAHRLIIGGYASALSAIFYDPSSKAFHNASTVTDSGTSPSWACLSQDGTRLYSVDETVPGAVYAHSLTPSGQIKTLNRSPSGGNGTVHCSVSRYPGAKLLYAANYNSGSASVLKLDDEGKIVEQDEPYQLFQFHGSGPNPARQNQSYAHEIFDDPSGKFVYVPDLGADRLHGFKLDPANETLHAIGDTTFAPGSGPRHGKFYVDRASDATYLYVATEMGTTVDTFLFNAADGSLDRKQSLNILPTDGTNTTGYTGSEVAVSPDGKFVYAGLRGDAVEDHIVVLSRDGQNATLSVRGLVKSGGRTPRHFSLSTDPQASLLAVGNQDSGSVVVFERDVTSGNLTKAAQTEAEQVALALFA